MRALLGRAPHAVWGGVKGFWEGLGIYTRRRLVLAVAVAAFAAVLLAFAVPRLPCQFPGGDVCAPDDDAEAVVPADALGYVHLSLDPESSQYSSVTEALDVFRSSRVRSSAASSARCRGPTAVLPTSRATSRHGWATRRRWRSCPPAAVPSRCSSSRRAIPTGPLISPHRWRPQNR